MKPLDHADDDALDALVTALVRVVASADVDPLMKPFAAILAAARVSVLAADSDERIRHKLAASFVVVVRALTPELVVDLRPGPPQAH